MLKKILLVVLLIQTAILIADERNSFNNNESSSEVKKTCQLGCGIAFSEMDKFKLRTHIGFGKFSINLDLGYYPQTHTVDSLKKGSYPGTHVTQQREIVSFFSGFDELNTKSQKFSLITSLSYELLEFDDFNFQLFVGPKFIYNRKTICKNNYIGLQHYASIPNNRTAYYEIEQVNNNEIIDGYFQFSILSGAGAFYKLWENCKIGVELPLIGDGESFIFSTVYSW